jgi:uncharacterized protein YchJ
VAARARFSAYCKALPQYVVDSTHPDCPLEAEFRQEDGSFSEGLLKEASAFSDEYEFQKLSILQASPPAPDAMEARVVFKVTKQAMHIKN